MPKKETPAKRLPQSPQLCEGLRGVYTQTVWVKTWSRKNEGWGDRVTDTTGKRYP